VRVGAILKACRTRAGYSQEELAAKLYINQSDVSKYENDTMEPHLNTFMMWMNQTQSQEVLIAFLCGVDGLSIMQQLMDSGVTLIGMILGGVF